MLSEDAPESVSETTDGVFVVLWGCCGSKGTVAIAIWRLPSFLPFVVFFGGVMSDIDELNPDEGVLSWPIGRAPGGDQPVGDSIVSNVLT